MLKLLISLLRLFFSRTSKGPCIMGESATGESNLSPEIAQLINALGSTTWTERQAAARALGSMGVSGDNSKVVAALVKALPKEKNSRVVGELMRALYLTTRDAQLVRKHLPQRIDPHSATDIFWFIKGLTPADEIRAFVDAAAIPPPSPEAIDTIEQEWHTRADGGSILITLLGDASRLAWFDCEGNPADYVRLIGDLGAITGGIFNADSVVQEFQGEMHKADEAVQVHFVYNNRAYNFTANNHEWYDPDILLASLNGALADAGRAERFISLYMGDQTALVTFAPEAAFWRAARSMGVVNPGDVHFEYGVDSWDWVDLHKMLAESDAR